MNGIEVLSDLILEIGVDLDPNLRVSSDDVTIRRMVRFINAAGRELMERAEWSRLTRDASVPRGTLSWPLPDDHHRLADINPVRLNTDPLTEQRYKPVRLVVAPEQWAFISARPSRQDYCYLNQGRLLFSNPVPLLGATVTYISDNWVEGHNALTQDGDVFNLPPNLLVRGALWRWLRQEGDPSFQDVVSEYEGMIEREIFADRGIPNASVAAGP